MERYSHSGNKLKTFDDDFKYQTMKLLPILLLMIPLTAVMALPSETCDTELKRFKKCGRMIKATFKKEEAVEKLKHNMKSFDECFGVSICPLTSHLQQEFKLRLLIAAQVERINPSIPKIAKKYLCSLSIRSDCDLDEYMNCVETGFKTAPEYGPFDAAEFSNLKPVFIALCQHKTAARNIKNVRFFKFE